MLLFVLFFIVLVLYSVFSYILTEPNLVLSSHPTYWNFQLYMWERFYGNPQFITGVFVFLVLMMFLCYLWIIFKLKERKIEFKLNIESNYLWAYKALLLPLFFSYNALSHDIFNYLFNAKMVLVYGYNPHIKTALDFINIDSWVRFMHNIHTTAPYGYGWTALSLIPSFLGQEKFLLTLVLFRLFMICSLFFLYFALQHLSQTLNKRKLYVHELALVFLNPLLLLEVVSNYHNDLWMMAPAVFAVSMLLRLLQESGSQGKLKNKALYFIAATLFLVFSISIKLVTIVIVPIFIIGFLIIFFLQRYSQLIQARFKIPVPTVFISQGLLFLTRSIEKLLPTILAILLFIPLFTARSQQFLPWYLVWILVWVPFIKNKALKNTILVFSLSSLLRYVPWLKNGFEYSSEILLQQKVITWLIPVVYLFTRIKDLTITNKKLSRM